MQFYNLKEPSERVSFSQAVMQGLGQNQGLFFPAEIPFFDDIDALLEQDFITRSATILHAFIGDELPLKTIQSMVSQAFNFPVPNVEIDENITALELFHGETLAFKDFGARFMAQCLKVLAIKEKITILTATSGDTGAAVAHAFYSELGKNKTKTNIQVVVLYPKGKISALQEKLFCTLGGNIQTLAIEGSFDDCQTLVKQAFDDEELRTHLGLNSANSINISRLLAQICYYFESVAQLNSSQRKNLVVSVPSGNFGNLTAGLPAKAMGLPIKRFIAATNINDTVPRYLQTGQWDVRPTQQTLSNSMDVSAPNNWVRVEALCEKMSWGQEVLTAQSVDDEQVAETMKILWQQGYMAEPHSATAYHALNDQLKDGEHGVFLCTAHPAKFKSVVDEILNQNIPLPDQIAAYADRSLLSKTLAVNFDELKKCLMLLND